MKTLLIRIRIAILLVAGLGVNQPSQAASGPAPGSQERRVLSGIHTDAISVFAENGGLILATKADVDGNLGVRLDPDRTLFNVEESARTTIPAAPNYAFLGVAGGDVWLAPETNPGGAMLWPGFSAEGVPPDLVDSNQLTLRLESVTGPGTLHIYQTTAFGEPSRLFSSTGAVYRAWTISRGTHAHANWAFSAAGNYTLTFSVSALTNGVSISTTQNYAFVVGNVPAAVATTTMLSASDNTSVLGDAVTLTAAVNPTNAVGWVEFLDGATVLGHDAVNAGGASLSTTSLLLGTRSVRARFVPQWLNHFSASTSAPVVITNTEPGGVPFGIAGVAASYLPGDTLTATAVGVTLSPDLRLRWLWRVAGESVHETGLPADSYSRVLSASDDGYELAVTVWRCPEGDDSCGSSESSLVAQSSWVSVHVGSIGNKIAAQLTSPASARVGNIATIALSGRELAPDETIEVVHRFPGAAEEWARVDFFAVEGATVSIYLTSGGQYAVRVMNADGLAIAQSDTLAISVANYELQIAGVQGVYRPGATLQAQGIIHPENPNLHYEWSYFVPGGMPYYVVEKGNGPEAMTTDIPNLTLAHSSGVFFFTAFTPIGPPFVEEPGLFQANQTYVRVYVLDIDPGAQIFQFQPLADHYHQGNIVKLVLGADPQPAQGDQVIWEWRWPGADWAKFPGATGLLQQMSAEQALDGLQVRATLAFASANTTMLAGPVTIFHDDHGAPAWQQLALTGPTSVVAGNLITLTGSVSPASILNTYKWEKKPAGASEFTVISNAISAQLTFTATVADDGAQYRVSIIKPNGAVAYGPSPGVTLHVEEPGPMPLRRVVLDRGHIDLFELTWNSNAGHLDLKVKDDTTLYAPTIALRAPEDVTVLVDTALSELTFGEEDLPPGFEFIPRNQPVYFLDQSQQDGLPWPGWSTERFLDSLPEGVTVPYDWGSVEFAVEVSGPGDVVTFQIGSFGEPENRYIDTTDDAPDVIMTGSSIHVHTAWMFTKPGDYLLTVTPRAYPSFPSKANPLTGPARNYHFRVGPRPEFEKLPDGFEPSIVGAPDSVTNGTPVNLELVLDGPQPAIGGYQWYRFIDGVGIETIPGATNLAVSLTANPWDGAQVSIFDLSGRMLVHTGVQFLPPPSPPLASHNVSGHSDAPTTAGVSWATVYDGRSPLTRQVVTLIPQVGSPIVQEVAGNVTDAAFASVPAGVYTATVQAFNALGAGAVSAPSAPFTVQPQALSINRTGAGMATLTISTETGKRYQLETAPVATGPWIKFGAVIIGAGQSVNLDVPLSDSARFFRRATIPPSF